jgi:four helix bundle protein
MATFGRFEDMETWQTARQLANAGYDATGSGKFAKDYGLKDQIQRAAVSVMSNIAEGFESKTQALFIDFLGRAKGSAGEVRAQLYIARDRDYITQDQFAIAFELASRVASQIYRLMIYLQSRPNTVRLQEETLEYDL